MKICFVANLYSIHSIRWIQPVIDAGHNVYVVSYSKANLPLSGVKDIVNLPHIFNLPKLRFLYWGLWLRSFIHRIHPDILHAHQITAAGWICATTDYHPLVITGWGSDLLGESDKSIFRKLLLKYVLLRTDYLTVPSQIMYEKALELGVPQNSISLIPWEVETRIFKPDRSNYENFRKQHQIPPDSPVIFCPRGIHLVYNIDIVIKACHMVKENYPNLCLILLKYNHQPDYLKMIEQLIRASNMEASIIWLPAKSTLIDMAYLYQVSDIVISIPTSEGYGISVYESIASGVPTIITDLAVFNNELQDHFHVLKVPVRNPQETALALDSLLSDPHLRHFLTDQCIMKSGDFRVETRNEQVEAFYNSIRANKKWNRPE